MASTILQIAPNKLLNLKFNFYEPSSMVSQKSTWHSLGLTFEYVDARVYEPKWETIIIKKLRNRQMALKEFGLFFPSYYNGSSIIEELFHNECLVRGRGKVYPQKKLTLAALIYS